MNASRKHPKIFYVCCFQCVVDDATQRYIQRSFTSHKKSMCIEENRMCCVTISVGPDADKISATLGRLNGFAKGSNDFFVGCYWIVVTVAKVL